MNNNKKKNSFGNYIVLERDVDVAGEPYLVENPNGSGLLYFKTQAEADTFVLLHTQDGLVITLY